MRARTLLHAAGMAVSLLCLAYLGAKVMEAWQGVRSELVLSAVLMRLGGALVPILLGYLAAAMAWVALVRGLGVDLRPLTGAGIYLATQIGKYLPGNFAHYAGRVVLSMQRGFPAALIAVSMTAELVLLLAIAALFSLPVLGTIVLQSAWGRIAIIGALGALVLLVAGASVAAVAKRRWPARVREWLAPLKKIAARPISLPLWTLAAVLFATSITLSSVSLLALEDTAIHLRLPDLAAVVGLFSVAWIAGVLTPGMPAGLGVREAILVQGLSPSLGAAEALVCALLFRLLTTLADAIVFGIGMLMLRLAARTRPVLERNAGSS